MRAGLGFRGLAHVLLTHAHLDHVLGLAGLLATLDLYRVDGTIEIIGSEETVAFARRYVVDTIGPEREGGYRLRAVSPGPVLVRQGWRIDAFAVAHRGTESLGYRFQEEPRHPLISERLDALGVPAGPERAMLAQGRSVVLADGRHIVPEMVHGAPVPGAALASRRRHRGYRRPCRAGTWRRRAGDRGDIPRTGRGARPRAWAFDRCCRGPAGARGRDRRIAPHSHLGALPPRGDPDGSRPPLCECQGGRRFRPYIRPGAGGRRQFLSMACLCHITRRPLRMSSLNDRARTILADPGHPADRLSRQRQDDGAQSRAEAARHGRHRGHRQRVRRDRFGPSFGRAIERGCRIAQQRVPVLHRARRHRRHLDQSVCRPGQGRGPIFHPRRDRDHWSRRSGADPAHLDDRPDRRGALYAGRRRDDRRCGQRGRHPRPAARGGEAGRGRRPAAADQDRPRQLGCPAEH